MLAGLHYGAPRWLVEALGETWNEGCFNDLNGTPGFDHVRTFRDVVAISQPYEASERLGVVLTKLDEQGINVRLWGISPYYPGHTFSMVIWREQDHEAAREIIKRMHAPFAADACKARSHEQWT